MNFVPFLLLLSLSVSSTNDCSLPPGYQNQTTRTENGIIYKFAMEKFVYIHGDTIHFYYVVENVGTEAVSFDVFTHDPNHAFVIYPDSCSALDQPGCYDAAIYFYPEATYLPPQPFTLLPGECEIFTRTWDQIIPLQGTYPDPGYYNAFAGLWQANPDWPGMFLYNSELSLDIVIETEPISVEASTWGRIKSLYWAESLSD